ncbi:MAG: AI-2E family transporter, partial [Paludibacter sp.]
MNNKPFTFDRVVRLLIGIAVFVLLFLVIQRLSNVLLPFLIAWLLAYLLQPLVRFFQYTLKLKSRVLSVICTLFLFVMSLGATIWFLTPLVISEVTKLSQLIVIYSNQLDFNSFVPIAWQNEIMNYLKHLNIKSVLQDENIMSGVKNLAPQLWNMINSSLDFVLGLAIVIIVFLYLIFILLDFEMIAESWYGIIPPKYRTLVMEIMSDLENGMNRYFRGQALVSLIVGVLFAIGFSIIQLPLAIVLGLLVGLFTMVPYLKVILLIPCATSGWLQSIETGQPFGSVLLGIAIVYIIIQTLEDVVISPKIMGKVTGLKPAVILLSLSIWGSLMGVLGMIIALPMTTLILSYYKRFVIKDIQNEHIEPDELKKDQT